jgi:Icc-related predicted phosphoesterase
MMRIIAISDTHGRHNRLTIPDGDVLIHAGDLTRNGKLPEVVAFNAFLGTLPHRHKLVIAGNHDWCFEKTPAACADALTNAIYLQDSAITLDGVRFYGSPWQPWFYGWAFNLRRGAEIRAKWECIDRATNVLITHGPPYGFGDLTADRRHVGCKDLLEFVTLIAPQAHIFGHVHEAAGVSTNTRTTFVNASICDIRDRPIHPAIIFDYPD